MSWIDDKYKNELGEKQYPDALKKRGWEAMESLLETQMPAAANTGAAAASTSPLYWVGVAAVLAMLVGLPLFIKYQPQDKPQTIENPGHNTTMEDGMLDNDPEPEPETATPASTLKRGTVQKADEKAPAEVAAEPVTPQVLMPEKKTTTKAVETATAAGKADGKRSAPGAISANEEYINITDSQALQEEASDRTVAHVDKVHEGLNNEKTTIAKDRQVADEQPYESLPIDGEVEYNNQLKKNNWVANEDDTQSEDEPGKSEKVPREMVTAEVAEPLSHEIADVNKIPKPDKNMATPDELLNSQTVAARKSAHLAFLEADEDAPLPDLRTLSRERFALSLWVGHLYTGKRVSGDAADLIKMKETAEKPIFTTPTGVNLDYYLNNNWTVGAGIGWAEYGEKADYNWFKVTSTLDSVSIDGRYDSPSNYPNVVSIDSSRVIDTVNQGHWNYHLTYRSEDSTARTYRGTNYFKYIEVPLTLGYRFGSGKIKPWVKGGVIIGLPVEASYSYPDVEAGSMVSQSSTAKLASVQYSALLQVGVDAYLNRSLSLRLNALGSYQLNPSLTYAGIRQNYYRIGLSVGLAYNF